MIPISIQPPRLPESQEKPQRSLRVLIVDDETAVRTFIATGVRRDGHQVEMVDDGVAALALHCRRPFDVVVADFMMPGINGAQLAAAIKRFNPATPVICITGHAEELTDSAFDLVIPKPFAHPVLR